MKKKTIEDYLRTIYLIYEDMEDKTLGVRSVDIARSLKITKPTVSEMIKKLAKLGYINTSPYSNIFLTTKGLRKAKRLSHDYRVIGVFLNKILKYNDLEKVDEEAHRLEHAFSKESIKRLDTFLNNPKKCPHGKIIHK
ncbi:metal-dependent transcriptional regulator [Candidatus Woesearchaeota archaeon]|nr:metal-dependent transcriptional regulator [Candidatus Woesearchaeota archaeon]